MSEVKFPTEVVDLPSKGLLYPKENPLSSGQVEIKYMTAKEEDILTSANLIKKGIVVDKLLEALIVDKSIKVRDLLVGDKNSLVIAARILAYGKEYIVKVGNHEIEIDLTKLKDKFIDEKLVVDGKNEFEFELPYSKRKLTFKLLTSGDEKVIDKEVEGLNKINKEVRSELTTRLKYMITAIDGDNKQTAINNFVENEFLSRDSFAFRHHFKSITPDVDMTATYIDPEDNEEKEMTVPLTVSFLWPTA